MIGGGGCNESMDGRQERVYMSEKSRPDVFGNFSSTYPKSYSKDQILCWHRKKILNFLALAIPYCQRRDCKRSLAKFFERPFLYL